MVFCPSKPRLNLSQLGLESNHSLLSIKIRVRLLAQLEGTHAHSLAIDSNEDAIMLDNWLFLVPGFMVSRIGLDSRRICRVDIDNSLSAWLGKVIIADLGVYV